MKDIKLIPLEEHHLELMLEWRNAPEVRRNMYSSEIITKEVHLNWYSIIKKDKSKLYFIFYYNDQPSGVVAFTELNKIQGISSWAFYTSQEAVRGSGSLMEYLALEYAFNTLKLKKLRCEVLGFNKAVVKLHTKFGFQIEGTLRSAFYDGEQYQDVVHLGLFPEEWLEVKESIIKKLKI